MGKYKFNQNSYAYQKGKSIKQCVDKHIKGKGFIKYDIKKFFENIRLENLSKCFAQILEIDNRFLNELDEILNVSDRIAVIHDGKIQGIVTPETTNKQELGILMAGGQVKEGASNE